MFVGISISIAISILIVLYYVNGDDNDKMKEYFDNPYGSYTVAYKDNPCQDDDTYIMYDPQMRSDFAPYGALNGIFSDTDYECVPKGQTVSLDKNKGEFCIVSSGQNRVIGMNDAWHPIFKLAPGQVAACETVSSVKSL